MRFHAMKAAVLCAALALGGSAQADVMATNSTYGNFDGTTGTRDLVINSHGTVGNVYLTVDFSKCDDPAIGPNGTGCIGQGDGFADEMSLYLTGPNGQMVTLVAPGTYGENNSGHVVVTFDDQAPQQVGPVLASGTFRPVESLSVFNGIDMYGTWTLTLSDAFPGDPLEYFSSTLDISGQAGGPPPASVPEPASAAIVALGLVGLAGARRRRKHGA